MTIISLCLVYILIASLTFQSKYILAAKIHYHQDSLCLGLSAWSKGTRCSVIWHGIQPVTPATRKSLRAPPASLAPCWTTAASRPCCTWPVRSRHGKRWSPTCTRLRNSASAAFWLSEGVGRFLGCLAFQEHVNHILRTDLLRQVCVLPHWRRRCRSSLLSHPFTVGWL